jgi:molybdopterin-guanine dinucleotide biosynthesis protein A
MGERLPRAILLAGGESRRFGSDKAMARFRGTTLAAFDAAELLTVFACVLIVAKDPGRLGLPASERIRLVKEVSPVRAALVGLAAGLRASDRELNYVVGVDMPGLAPAAVRLLYTYARGRGAALRCDEGGRVQPLGGFYARRALPLLEQCLAAEQYRLTAVLSALDVAALPYEAVQRADPEGRSFWNVNTPDDLRQIEAHWPATSSGSR